jgi:hypothetical protein
MLRMTAIPSSVQRHLCCYFRSRRGLNPDFSRDLIRAVTLARQGDIKRRFDITIAAGDSFSAPGETGPFRDPGSVQEFVARAC